MFFPVPGRVAGCREGVGAVVADGVGAGVFFLHQGRVFGRGGVLTVGGGGWGRGEGRGDGGVGAGF